MPGTVGSLWGLLVYGMLLRFDLWIAVLLTVLGIFAAIWIAHESEKIIGGKDPGSIVIDEIAGMVVTFLGVPFHVAAMIAGFILFRLIDIIKPFPIRRIEASVPGGAGIVLDDIAAGIISNVLLRSGLFILSIYH